jgi:hypothetical protein
MFLTLEQASEMSREDCEAHIKKLARNYKLEKPIMEVFAEVWADCDDIANTLLYCEDRISALELAERLKYANDQRWGRTGEAE